MRTSDARGDAISRYRSRGLVLSIVALAAAIHVAPPAVAGVGVWTSHGPRGGTVRTFAIDRSRPNTIYAVISPEPGGDPAGVFKSTNGGMSWSAVNVGLTASPITLAIDPTTPDRLYAGTDAGVFKSTNGGASWVSVSSGLGTSFVWTLAIDRATPSTLYAGTNGDGVFKTTNGGDTWIATNGGLTALTVDVLAIDPVTPRTLYAGTSLGGVFKSSDGGSSWAPSNTGLPENIGATTLMIDPSAPSTLYVGSGNVSPGVGVFKSTNGGDSWAPMNTGLSNLLVRALAIDPTIPNTLYAGTDDGVFKSANGGVTWASANTGIGSLIVEAIVVDPTASNTVYAGALGGGVFKSTDAGTSWAASNTGLSKAYVLASAIDPHTPSTLYAGTVGGGVFKSTDGGTKWAPFNTGLRAPFVLAMAVDPTRPNTLYAGTAPENVVFKSTDGGTTWAGSAGLPSGGLIRALAIDPITSDTLYAGTEVDGVFKSTNGGTSWGAANTGLSDSGVLSLAIDPAMPSTLYAGTHSLSDRCPEFVEVASTGGSTDAFDLGWTGLAHHAPLLSNGKLTFTLACDVTTPPCGTCAIGGPIQNLDADAAGIELRICSRDPSIRCTSDADCGDGQCRNYGLADGATNVQRCSNNPSHKCRDNAECPGGQCVFFSGPPLPLSAGGVAACLVNQVNGGVAGTANVESGAFQLQMTLTSRVHAQIATDQPCPRCDGDLTLNDGNPEGSCNGGSRDGQACDANAPSPISPFGPTSLDCPPAGVISSVVVPLAGSSGTQTRTLDANSPDCTDPGAVGDKCFCPATGSQPTRPNACLDDTIAPASADCTPLSPGSNDGECPFGPVDRVCFPLERFRSCSSNAECTAPGDTCQTVHRPCYLDDGVVGGTVTALGSTDTPTFTALFCAPPVAQAAINAAAGLPGLGRLEMPLSIRPFTLTQHGPVLKSTNGGQRWEAMGIGMSPNVAVRALTIDPTSPSTLYAGTNGGVFKTTDGGERWAPMSTGLTYPFIEDLAIDLSASETVYAGTNGGGVFKSTDGGATWAPLNTGLTNQVVRSLAIDPTSPSTLYAGTAAGVFRIDQVSPGGESVAEIVAPGASCSTDTEGPGGVPDGATSADLIETTVFTAGTGGVCAIHEQAATGSPLPGYRLFGYAIEVAAPSGSVLDPLTIVFVIDQALIPPGQNLNTLQLLKDGVPVGTCSGAAVPCVRRDRLPDGDVRFTVITDTASIWSLAVPSLDSYLCYASAASKNASPVAPSPGHHVRDALDSKRVDLVKPGNLCLPAARDGAPITDDATALQAVALKIGKVCSDSGLACKKKQDCPAPAICAAPPKFVARKNVTVLNALGAQVVDVTKPTIALLPSATSASAPPGVPDPALDTFKCYATKPHTKVCIGDPTRACTDDAACGDAAPCFTGLAKDLTVQLSEPVGTAGGKVFTVKKPTALCLPADVDGVARKVPTVALQCYAIAPAKKQPKHAPVVGFSVASSALGTLRRDTKKEVELCVPSEVIAR